jgi:hypothetical protein
MTKSVACCCANRLPAASTIMLAATAATGNATPHRSPLDVSRGTNEATAPTTVATRATARTASETGRPNAAWSVALE